MNHPFTFSCVEKVDENFNIFKNCKFTEKLNTYNTTNSLHNNFPYNTITHREIVHDNFDITDFENMTFEIGFNDLDWYIFNNESKTLSGIVRPVFSLNTDGSLKTTWVVSIYRKFVNLY
jgi:hypothetical protein